MGAGIAQVGEEVIRGGYMGAGKAQVYEEVIRGGHMGAGIAQVYEEVIRGGLMGAGIAQVYEEVTEKQGYHREDVIVGGLLDAFSSRGARPLVPEYFQVAVVV